MAQRVIALNAHTNDVPCESAWEQMRISLKSPFNLEDIKRHQEPIYAIAGAAADDVFALASSSAEAVARIIWSVFTEKSRKEGKTQWIASCIEDAPTLQMLKRCEELGCSVKIASLDSQGRIDVAKLAELITPRTALISITAAHGLTGVVQPVEAICELARSKGVLIHLEASYLLGQTPFSFHDTGADYLTFSGARIHSIPGSGGLFAKKGSPLVPLIPGALLDAAALAALSAACRMSLCSLDSMSLETARLRDRFEALIVEQIPGAKPLFQQFLRLPNTSVILFPFVHAESLEYFLQTKGVLCNRSGDYLQQLPRVLDASSMQTESALSFSLSRMTTEEEIVQAVHLIQESVEMLQEISKGLFI